MEIELLGDRVLIEPIENVSTEGHLSSGLVIEGSKSCQEFIDDKIYFDSSKALMYNNIYYILLKDDIIARDN